VNSKVTSEVISGNQRTRSLFGRRDFFAAIAAAIFVPAPHAASALTVVADAGDGRRQSRYKETEHIKTFYEVNRL
jgi:hypothetical protein